MSQQIENKDPFVNDASRLPLRKRIGPVLKWQPVETPDDNFKPKAYPSPQQYPIFSSSEDIISDESHDTDEDKLRKQKEELKRSEKDELVPNRPVKKAKRGRPPLQRNSTPVQTPSLPSTPPSLPQTITTTRPPTDNTNTLYCICKRPYDVPRFMIACDKCNEWFHGECIGISEKQGEFIDLYFCDSCSQLTGKSTSWKPQCANPACSKAARIGTHQGHFSKYCSDSCGMQVARARIELAEQKKKTALGDENHVYNPLSRGKLSSFADMDDRARLARVKEEKEKARSIIAMGEQKSAFLKILTEHQKEDVCGFDSRLSWPDSFWAKVDKVVKQPEDNHHMLLGAEGESLCTSAFYQICQSNKKCSKHASWQKLKASEYEQERAEQFVILSILERERQQIKARMKKRREEVDLVDFLENGTITHFK